MVGSVSLIDVKEIFDATAALSADERDVYLDASCSSDDVRKRVGAMLAAFDSGDAWLGPLTRVQPDDLFQPAPEEALPDHVGRYRVRRRIATGGMGTVYEGVQDEPRRVVAIKVLRRNLARPSALRRFRDEAQILGRLRHPAIAQIFDAAVHKDEGDDLPYFVMEFVPAARSLTKYTRERELGIPDRIALFIRVCEGVHHGHQKGVVHRDLKPDNLLVDGDGQPKIIDFGVARTTDADVALTTMRTDIGQLVGTLQYMSPEQLEGDPHDIDTRSDVYALGIVLFELLTGRTPHDIGSLSVSEALHVLRETKPAHLSSIAPKLRGDLETIVTKAMEHDRDRRYHSAQELGQDLQRYLSGEAISARPPSLAYHLRVTVRRHRTAVIAAGVVFFVISASAVASTMMLIRTVQAKAETAEERDNAIEARDRAQAAEAFLGSMLTAVAPETPEEEIPFQAILDEASQMLTAGALDEQPLTEASVRQTIARAYRGQRLLREAEPHLRAAAELYETTLGPEAYQTLIARIDLANNTAGQGRWAEVTEYAQQTLETCERVLDPEDRLILGAVLSYAFCAQSVEGWRRALEARIKFNGPDSRSAHFGMHVLGRSLSTRGGEPKAGLVYQKRAFDYFVKVPRPDGSLDSNVFEAREFLSGTYFDLGLAVEAETILEPIMPDAEAARQSGKRVGHRRFLFLARAMAAQGRLGEAEAISRPEYARARDHLGDENWISVWYACVLVDILREGGQLEEAVEIALDEARFADITDDEVPFLASYRAMALCDAGELEPAVTHARRALDTLETTAAILVPSIRLDVAEVLFADGASTEALTQLRLAMAHYDAKCEPAHWARSRARRLLGAIRHRKGETVAAEAALREAIAMDIEWRGPDHRETAKSRLAIGRFLGDTGRVDEARVELDEARRILGSSPFEEGLWLPRVEEALTALDHEGTR